MVPKGDDGRAAPAGWGKFPALLPALACLAMAARVAAAEPTDGLDPRNYAVFDAVFLQRNNAAVHRPVVVSSTQPSIPLLSAGDPGSTIGTGVRLLYGNHGPEDIGWEAGYLGVYGMRLDRTVADPGGTLQAPNPIFAAQTGMNDASLARMTGDSRIDSAEINLVVHEYDGGYDRRSPRPAPRCQGYDGGHLDWIGGFRWAALQDSAVLALAPGTSAVPSTYGVTTLSNLFAAQVGTRARMQFERWGLEGWMKIGIAGTTLSQSQSIYDALEPPIPFRSPASADRSGMGMIADMNVSAIYRINDVWGLRVGYNLMWLTGVALAADQWDFTPSRTGGSGLAGAGSVFLNGGNLGLEARW